MGARRFLVPALIWASSVSAAIILASLRYDTAAFRPIAAALGATGLACLILAAAIKCLPAKVTPRAKTALFVTASSLLAIMVTVAAVGIDGILPDKNGGQSIGAMTCLYNVDLFALIIAATRIACRRCFKPKT